MTKREIASVVAETVFVTATAFAAVPQSRVAIQNPGFEDPYVPVASSESTITGMVARGWHDNSSWADVTVQYSRDTANPHGGGACQKVEVGAVLSGAVQLSQNLPLQKGFVYTGTLWVRGGSGTRVTVVLQQSAPPYRTYADSPVILTGAWQLVSVSAHIPVSGLVSFMIWATRPGTFWVDDAAVSNASGPITPAPLAGPVPLNYFGMHVDNFLESIGPNTLDFEDIFIPVVSSRASIRGKIARFWSDNSDWADVTVTYSRETSRPRGGRSAQRIDVRAIQSGAVQLAQRVQLDRSPGRRARESALIPSCSSAPFLETGVLPEIFRLVCCSGDAS